MIHILHLSDLHFVKGAGPNNMRAVLLKEAETVHDLKLGEKLLIITGDFHNFSDKDYNQAEEFLNDLIERMDIERTQDVFVIPGNHDVGNDDMLEKRIGVTEPYWKQLQEYALDKIMKGSSSDFESNLEIRLKAFLPYCDFTRKMGIYDENSNETLPAQVHVRNWRERLNLMHLNTALAYHKLKDGEQRDTQKADTNTATGDSIWSRLNCELPALVLGHNSFFDIEKVQRNQLRVPFWYKNVSAYLCGDTHRKERDVDNQMIRLETGQRQALEIPNVVCAKGVADDEDDYSDFGFYWHRWDTETDWVKLEYCSWKPENLTELKREIGDDGYRMRRGDPTKKTNPYSELSEYLQARLKAVRSVHSSLMPIYPEELDVRLFPCGSETLEFLIQGTKGDEKPHPVWDYIAESWQDTNNHNIVIEGEGGAGKTVTLLCPTVTLPAPAIYIQLFELVQAEHCWSIAEYLQIHLTGWAAEIDRLAAHQWENGPSLLLLLDGFNEIPPSVRREVLHQLNSWHITHPGAQLIIASRPLDSLNLLQELAGESFGIRLMPISKEIVSEYLIEQGLNVPEETSPLWNYLGLPLFLIMYAKTEPISELKKEGYPLDYKEARGPSTIFWNYLQRELLRKDGKAGEDWVLHCAIACEYILPKIAYNMQEQHKQVISQEEVFDLSKCALSELCEEKKPTHLTALWMQYYTEHFVFPELGKVNWNSLLLRELNLLLPVANMRRMTYCFPHQYVRDYLAGIYLVSRAEMASEGELPKEWKRTPNLSALDYAAELMDKETSQKLWEANRMQNPTNRAATYAMLELQKRRPKQLRSELDFSGMDLRGISLVHYLGGAENDLLLFSKALYSRATKLDAECFRGQGHLGMVNCVAVTLDDLCVSGAQDCTLRVWDIRTGICLHTFTDHVAPVSCVAITPDGCCISGSQDGKLLVWDIQSGRCLQILRGHLGGITCVAVTAEGHCVSGSEDSTLKVWDIRSGECLRTLRWGDTGRVYCVTVTGDNLCVSGSDDNILRVWDLRTGACLRTLEGHNNRVSCVSITADGLCVSGSHDNTIRIWNLLSGECLLTLNGHLGPVDCIAISAEGLCVSGSRDSTMRVWDTKTGACLRVIEQQTHRVRCVAVTVDGLCVSGSEEFVLKLWDIRTGDCLSEWKKHFLRTRVITTWYDLCICGSEDGALRVWDVRNNTCLKTLIGHTGPVNCVAVTADGLCVSGSQDCTLRVWDIRTGICLHTYTDHVAPVSCVAITPDGLCVSGSWDSILRVWDIRSGICLKTLTGFIDRINCIAIAPNGLCVSGSQDCTLRVWDIQSGRCLQILRGHLGGITSAAFTADGLCVSGSQDHTLRVWDIQSGKCLQVFEEPSGGITSVAVTMDGLCVSGFEDSTLRVWDIHTGQCLHILKYHTHRFDCVTAIGRNICIYGSMDESILVWNILSGEIQAMLYPMECHVSSMVFLEAITDSECANALLQNGAVPPKAYLQK